MAYGATRVLAGVVFSPAQVPAIAGGTELGTGGAVSRLRQTPAPARPG
jgi:hypothetical protein